MNAHRLTWLFLGLCCACERSPRATEEPSGAAQPAASVVTPAKPAEAAAPTGLLPLGAPLPAVSATAHNGERVQLADFVGKPVVVYFYPKDDTPGCTVEAQEIRDLWSEMKASSAVVIGVSTDDAESHKAFADKHALPFLLLPDSDHSIAKAFGVPLQNGRARRVSFVFSADGRLAKVFPDVTPRGHGSELLAAVKSTGR